MFVKAISTVDQFTKPIHFITRYYGSTDILPETATLFFVNEDGYAVTCKHVAEQFLMADAIYSKYIKFKEALTPYRKDPAIALHRTRLEERFGLNNNTVIRIKGNFIQCTSGESRITFYNHPTYDLAIIRFVDFDKKLYNGHAYFLGDDSAVLPGKSLCRLGYPFPEFKNYQFNSLNDDIEFTQDGRITSPAFPLDGIVTRQIADSERIFGIEMSTPGLRGQSGGPLFDTEGVIYGMQSATHHIHLGFDQVNREVISEGVRKRVSNYPFLSVGRSIHVSIIKEFLRSKGVRYYEA